MKKTLGITLLATLGLVTSTVALANDAVFGALIGGGAGAVIGSSVGGRNGAIVGGAIGAATGVVIASEPRHRHEQRVEYYAPQPVYYTSQRTYYTAPPAYYPPPQVYYAPPPVRIVAPPTVYLSGGHYDQRHHRHYGHDQHRW